MRPHPPNLKNILHGNSEGEEPENEENDLSLDEEESEEENDEDNEIDEEEAAHQARMEVLREENRRLVAIGEEEDRQLRNEIQQRDQVLRRIRDLEKNIDDLRRRRDERK